MAKLLPITLPRVFQYWWVAAVGMAVLTVIFWAINQFVLGERFTHPWLDQYAENDLRVGDRASRLLELGEPISAAGSGDIRESSYRSKKNPNLTMQFSVDSNNLIESVRFPLTLAENVRLSTLVLPPGNYIEYWAGPGVPEVIRLYPNGGIGLNYHFSTLTVSALYQFFPDRVSSFVERQEWLPRTEAEPAIQVDEYDPNQPPFINDAIDITSEATKPAEALP
jgi:hypothetical protein